MIRLIILVLLIPSLCFAGVDLNGDDDYINASDSSSLDVGGAGIVSISMWINLDDVTALSWWLSKTDFGQNKRAIHLYFDPTGTDAIEFAIDLDGASGGSCFYEWQQTPTTGTWEHYVAIYNKNNTATNRMKLYKDGVLQSATVNVEATTNVLNNDVPLTIGAGRSSGTYSGFMNGQVSEVYIWDGVELSQREVDLLANSNVKRIGLQIQPSSLVAYYPLDDHYNGTALGSLTFRDLSGNENTMSDTDADGDSTAIAEEVLSYP